MPLGEEAIVDKERQKYVVIGQLQRGDMFGEQSALNDEPNPFTIVAATPKVEYYKIHRNHFKRFFDGHGGEIGQGASISQMRANVVLKNNWLFAKVL